MHSAAETTSIVDIAGKYLTFHLGQEIYGVEILKVQEIIGMMRVTSVPRTPDFVRGVINLRGKVIPVIDLRLKFDLDATDDTDRTCIIVVQVRRGDHHVVMGIIVDAVSEVLDVGADSIEESPELGSGIDTDFILGLGKIGAKVVILLDVDKVLVNGEAEQLKEMLDGDDAAV